MQTIEQPVTWLKSVFLSLLLFILCIVIVTPLTLLDKLAPIKDAAAFIAEEEIQDHYFMDILEAYFTPLIFFLFNYILVPYIINVIVDLEDF